MAGIFDNPMAPPGGGVTSSPMALDDDKKRDFLNPDKCSVLHQEPGITEAASGEEEDPWAV